MRFYLPFFAIFFLLVQASPSGAMEEPNSTDEASDEATDESKEGADFTDKEKDTILKDRKAFLLRLQNSANKVETYLKPGTAEYKDALEISKAANAALMPLRSYIKTMGNPDFRELFKENQAAFSTITDLENTKIPEFMEKYKIKSLAAETEETRALSTRIAPLRGRAGSITGTSTIKELPKQERRNSAADLFKPKPPPKEDK